MTEPSPLPTYLAPENHSDEGNVSGRMYSAACPVNCVEVRIVDADERKIS